VYRLRDEKSGQKPERGAAGRHEGDIRTVHKANEPRPYHPVHLYSRYFWPHLTRAYLSLSLSLLLPSGFLERSSTRPALHRISISRFPPYHPVTSSPSFSPGTFSQSCLLCVGARVCVARSSDSILRAVPTPLSRSPHADTCTGEKEWRETSAARNGESRHPSTANPSFLPKVIGRAVSPPRRVASKRATRTKARSTWTKDRPLLSLARSRARYNV